VQIAKVVGNFGNQMVKFLVPPIEASVSANIPQ
jgi:hypothetical protein